MQAVAACGVGPVNVQVVPVIVSDEVHEQDALSLLGVHAAVIVGVAVLIVNVACDEPATPVDEVPLTVNVYAPFLSTVYALGDVQAAAADGVGPASEQLAPEAFSVRLGVNVQLAPLPVTVQAGLNVSVAPIVNVATPVPALPSESLPVTVNV